VTATPCHTIDTLAMAYLDDELAGEERHELETHIIDCDTCRRHLDAERADHELVRARLVAPPAPDLLRKRIALALDGEDAQATRAERRRWSSYLLPASASVAAVAALAAFVFIKPAPTTVDPVVVESVRQGTHPAPLEVQGASNVVTPWLHEHFKADVQVPQFSAPGIHLVGTRLTAIDGHDAARLDYDVNTGDARFRLMAMAIPDIGPDALSNGVEVYVGNRMVHLIEYEGQSVVTYVAPDHIGYAFIADRVGPEELLRLVVSSDLVGRVQRGE
jgi:anti-sigma factor RsiW